MSQLVEELQAAITERDDVIDLLYRCAKGNYEEMEHNVDTYEKAFRECCRMAAVARCIIKWVDNWRDGRETDGCPKGRHLCGIEALLARFPPQEQT